MSLSFPAYDSKLEQYRKLYAASEERLRIVSLTAVSTELMRMAHAVYVRRFGA